MMEAGKQSKEACKCTREKVTFFGLISIFHMVSENLLKRSYNLMNKPFNAINMTVDIGIFSF